MSTFRKLTKEQARLRAALCGPSGSGKTYTALILASRLVEGTGKRVAIVDTEHGSAAKYGDIFDADGIELSQYSPDDYVKIIRAAETEGYGAIVIDSLSHAWSGTGGALEQVDRRVARSNSRNSFAAWREVTPMHNDLVESILSSDLHVVATMRTKTEWIMEADSKGKMAPRKVGLKPVQRDGIEYEFDIVCDLDVENTLIVSKTRCPALAGGVYRKPGAVFADVLRDWLSDGVAPTKKAPAADAAPSTGTASATPGAPAGQGWIAQISGADSLDRLKEIAVALRSSGENGATLQRAREAYAARVAELRGA